MQISEAQSEALRMMEQNGLTPAWSLSFGLKALRILGRTNYPQKRIYLNGAWVQIAEPEEVRHTIIHEIAHALTEGDQHGPRWQYAAYQLGLDNPTAQRDRSSVTILPYRLNAVCPACGEVFYRDRLPRGGTQLWHSRCFPTNTPPENGILEWKKVSA